MRPLPVRGACCRWRKGEGDKAAGETRSATRADRWGRKAAERDDAETRAGPTDVETRRETVRGLWGQRREHDGHRRTDGGDEWWTQTRACRAAESERVPESRAGVLTRAPSVGSVLQPLLRAEEGAADWEAPWVEAGGAPP